MSSFSTGGFGAEQTEITQLGPAIHATPSVHSRGLKKLTSDGRVALLAFREDTCIAVTTIHAWSQRHLNPLKTCFEPKGTRERDSIHLARRRLLTFVSRASRNIGWRSHCRRLAR
jgi:hypothetical protein